MSYKYEDDDYQPRVECDEERIRNKNVVRTTIPTNQDCRIYNVRFPLYNDSKHCIKWERSGFTSGIYQSCSTMDFIAEQIVGIEEMFSPRSYELWVTRGKAFEWDEIEPKLFEILNQMS